MEILAYPEDYINTTSDCNITNIVLFCHIMFR